MCALAIARVACGWAQCRACGMYGHCAGLHAVVPVSSVAAPATRQMGIQWLTLNFFANPWRRLQRRQVPANCWLYRPPRNGEAWVGTTDANIPPAGAQECTTAICQEPTRCRISALTFSTPSVRVQDYGGLPLIGGTNSSSMGAGPLVDPVLLARQCLRDRDCRAFSNSGWLGASALPAVSSDRPGSCLYVYQEGEDTCGHC